MRLDFWPGYSNIRMKETIKCRKMGDTALRCGGTKMAVQSQPAAINHGCGFAGVGDCGSVIRDTGCRYHHQRSLRSQGMDKLHRRQGESDNDSMMERRGDDCSG